MASSNRSRDNELLAALRHPLRRRILQLMAKEAQLSPRELSATLEEPLTKVSYHVRVLLDCAAVTLVGTKPVRGATQHFYSTALEAAWAHQVLGLCEEGESPNDHGT